MLYLQMCLSGHVVRLTVTLYTTAEWRSALAASFCHRNAPSVCYVDIYTAALSSHIS